MDHDTHTFPVSYPLSFLARTAALTALACAGGMVILRWIFSRQLGSEYAPAFYTLKSLLGFLVPALVFCALAVFLVASLSVCVVAVFASHKVAGPLFRLQRIADHLARCVLVGPIHLRVGDQGKPVAQEINRFVDLQKERHARIRECCETLRACMVRWEQELASGSSRDPGETIQEIRSSIRELRHK